MLLGNREFTNLPRKFNVTITGCLENCCHAETQDIGLVPAYRELDGHQVNGFNVLVGGKQGSGGYRPAVPLDVFVRARGGGRRLSPRSRCIFRDHGCRAQRAPRPAGVPHRGPRRRLVARRAARRAAAEPLLKAGTDMRKTHHADHLGIHPQKQPSTATGALLRRPARPGRPHHDRSDARRRRPGRALRQRRRAR